jgi:hypothetical protein
MKHLIVTIGLLAMPVAALAQAPKPAPAKVAPPVVSTAPVVAAPAKPPTISSGTPAGNALAVAPGAQPPLATPGAKPSLAGQPATVIHAAPTVNMHMNPVPAPPPGAK